ncbi:hypothetical protein MKHDV_03657 [Halodesulfovibrio sp. MK-HDV]|nr:hypothetical protein MKHDV_03657 [Halodesulfovibrio sp. MK-HDV]
MFILIELHEYEVPDFEETVAITFSNATVRTTGHVFALIDMDFCTRTTRTGITHRPEIILFAETENFFFRHACFGHPDFFSFVIIAVDGDKKLICRKTKLYSKKFPCKADSIFFEVIAKAKVAEHFKKCVVACSTAYVFKVVVFAAYAQTLLGSGGTYIRSFFLTEECFFKLNHTCVGEEQSGVVGRNEGRRRHNFMSLVLEEFEKLLPNFVCGNHSVVSLRKTLTAYC